MDGSNGADEDPTAPEPTVASMLGIKGPLRFRTHGSTQKAHVVLRQVELSDDSGDEGDGKNSGKPAVYFSLFAQKRIEVKPGKEILLAVATPDGRFIETPVIFTGDLFVPNDPGECSVSLQPPQNQTACVQQPITMPPKMRKTWSRRVQAAITQSPVSTSPTYSSIGVQSDTTYSVQGVETSPELHIPRKTTAVQTTIVKKGVETQTDEILQTLLPPSHEFISTAGPAASEPISPPPTEAMEEVSEERERSLSPMELSSAASSPVLSPIVTTPIGSSPSKAGELEALPYSPRRLFLSTSSASVEDVHISPMHLSPDNGDPPGLSFSFFSTPTGQSTTPVDEPTSAHLQTKPTQELVHREVAQSHTAPVISDTAEQSHPPETLADNTSVSSEVNASTPAPYKPKRKAVPNPFVSGGFVTDFVGANRSQSSPSPGATEPLSKGSPPKNNSHGPSGQSSPSAVVLQSPRPPPHILSPPNPQEPKQNTSPVPSPSSSKLKVEDVIPGVAADIAVPSVPQQSIQPVPLPQELLSTHTPSPPLPSPTTPKFRYTGSPSGLSDDFETVYPPSRRLPPNLQSMFVPAQSVQRPSQPPPQNFPQPDPKTIAYIREGPYSNPLNIRPARNAPPNLNFQPATASNAVQKSAHKKRIVVGNGWPFNRQSIPSGAKGVGTNENHHSLPQGLKRNNGGRNSPLTLDNFGPPPENSPQLQSPSVSSSGSSWPQTPISNQVPETPGPQMMGRPRLGEDHEVEAYHPDQRFSFAQQAPTPMPLPAPTPMLPFPPPQMPPFPPTQPPLISTPYQQPPIQPMLPPHQLGPSHQPMLPYQPTPPPLPPPPSNRAEFSTPLPRQLPPMSMPAPMPHPLPPRPPAYSGGNTSGNWSPRRGLKRMGSPTPPPLEPTEPTYNADFDWPTVKPSCAARILGEGNVGVRTIAFNSDGTHFAVACWDQSVRIWNHRTRTEVAKLTHTMQVLAVAWMDHDSGVVTLGENGIVSTWTRNAQNKWQWAKILDARGGRQSEQKGSPSCLAFARDRIAIGFPGIGVKVWLFIKGTWLPQRSILRQSVTTIKFVEDGDALIGGTGDGVLWRCDIPNGTLRALTFLKNKIFSLDVDARGAHAMVSLTGGRAQLITIKQDDQRGVVEQTFAPQDPELQNNLSFEFGVAFACRNQAILFGSTRGCVMVWDRNSAEVISGFSHSSEADVIQAVSCFDGSQAVGSQVVTGTRSGILTWFTPASSDGQRKRAKVA